MKQQIKDFLAKVWAFVKKNWDAVIVLGVVVVQAIFACVGFAKSSFPSLAIAYIALVIVALYVMFCNGKLERTIDKKVAEISELTKKQAAKLAKVAKTVKDDTEAVAAEVKKGTDAVVEAVKKTKKSKKGTDANA